MRITVQNLLQTTNIAQVLGSCASDTGKMMRFINEAQERLIKAGGEAGWWGSWYRVAFTVQSDAAGGSYLTLPSTIARLIDVTVCKTPVRVQNEFYEFLDAGIGLMPITDTTPGCGILELYDRGWFPTFTDLTPGCTLRVYASDSRDVSAAKRILIAGTDTNDNVIRNTDGVYGREAEGEFITLDTPFADSVATFNSIAGVQKDLTYGDVRLYQVDPVTAAETLLSQILANEQTCAYRRYYINGLPSACSSAALQVVGLAKLEFIPVQNDTDYLLIWNRSALKAECECIRYEQMDNIQAQQLALLKHKQAIAFLNQELTHYLGKQRPAVQINLFGSAKLADQSIGKLI